MKTIEHHRLFAFLLLFITLGASAFAQITPSQDSYSNTADPTTNYGTAATLGVVSSTTSIQTTYIKFDLSSIPAGYTGANAAKATLKLYVNSVAKAGSFNVDFVNGSWGEKTITSTLAPALGKAIASSVPLSAASANDYVLIDVTTAVQDWLNGSEPNDGIALVANSGFSATFDSKENSAQSHPAELDIVYASGNGTITGVTTASGSGLTGGGTSGALDLSLQSCSTNQVLQWKGSAWACAAAGTGTISGVTAGTGLTGGGNSGNVTLNLDTTKVPQIGGNNTFAGNNTFTGNTTSGTPTTAVIQSGTGIGLEIQSLSTGTGVDPALTVYEGSNNGSAILANAPSANGVGVYATGGGAGLIGNSARTGVEGQTTTGIAGVFLATSGGKLLSGQNSLHEVFSVGNSGNVTGASGNFSGNMTVGGSLAATSFTGDGSQLSNIAALSANNGFSGSNTFSGPNTFSGNTLFGGNNSFWGFNYFQQATTFTGSSESAVIGDMGCGGNSVGITFQAINCGSYALLDYSGQTILNRVSGQNMSFREGNAPDQMTLLSGGGINLNPGSKQVIVSANGTDADYGNGLATVQVLNYTSDTNTQMFAAMAPNNDDANCVIVTSGDFWCSGSKSAVVPVDGGSRKVALYAVEAPENWFEDYGGGTLMNGSATVTLDPTFAQTVNTGESYRVFVTPNGDCKGLYVTQKTPTSFEVHELAGGQANIEFDYRIIAKRKGYEKIRMADKTELIRSIKQAAQERDGAATLPVARKH